MTVENAQYIQNLNSAYPDPLDDRHEGDDHIRMIKQVLVQSFPGIGGAVTRTHAQLNKAPHDRASMETLLGSNRKIVTADAFSGTANPPPEIAFGWDNANGRLKALIGGAIPLPGIATENDLSNLRNDLGLTSTKIGAWKNVALNDIFFLGKVNDTTFTVLQSNYASVPAGVNPGIFIPIYWPYKVTPVVAIPVLLTSAGNAAVCSIGQYMQVTGTWGFVVNIQNMASQGGCRLYTVGQVATNPFP